MSTAMPVCSISASRSISGSSTSASRRRAAALLDLVVERVGEVDDRAGVQHRGVGGVGGARVVERVEGQLPVIGRALLELALEVAQRQVGQVVGPLVGPGEVGREGGVADQPAQRPAARRQGEHRPLGVVQHLGARGVGEPGHQRRVVLGRDLAGVDPGAGAVGRREGQRPDLAGARAPAALGRSRRCGPRSCVRRQPVAHLALAEADAGQLEARTRRSARSGRPTTPAAARAAPGTPGSRTACARAGGPTTAPRGRREPARGRGRGRAR